MLEEGQVEIELQRGEAAIGHLGRASRVRVGGVHAGDVVRCPVHLGLGRGELVDRLAHPREPPGYERRAVARERVARVAVGVDAHAVAVAAAEQLPERHIERARGEVPERRLDARDRVVHGAAARNVRGREVQSAHQRLDVTRIASLEERSELADRLREAGRAERLAPAVDAVVALDADDRPVVVRLEDGGRDPRDLHQPACSRTMRATTPLRSSISAKASSKRSSGNRCVTIGSRSTSPSRRSATMCAHAAVV